MAEEEQKTEAPRQMPAGIETLFRQVLRAGLERVEAHKKAGKWIDSLTDYPEMAEFDSGVPNFTKSLAGPPDYHSVFRQPWTGLAETLGMEPAKYEPPDEIPSWKEFLQLAESNPTLRHSFQFDRSRMNPGHEKEWQKFMRLSVLVRLADFVDRYIHTTGSTEFKEEVAEKIYREWERSVTSTKLPIQIVIPIVFLGFSPDLFAFTDAITIERMTRGLQLARNTKRAFTVQSHECVVGGATHALFLQGWEIPNRDRGIRDETLYSPEAFSSALEQADLVFAALRVATGYAFGYSQIVARPIGWSDGSKADLETVFVSSLRRYPEQFENYGWLRQPDVVSQAQCELAKRVFEGFSNDKGGALMFASRRLNAAALRANEEDAIVDIASGIESLLSDGSQEIGYKLRARLAALAIFSPPADLSPLEVWEATSKVYDFRSTVVHGGKRKLEKVRTVTLGTASPIPTVELGLRILRFAIEALATHPEFLCLTELDRFMVTRALPAARP